MQLPGGGHPALAILSNPTEASCTFHMKKMENSVQKQSQPCKVVMKPISCTLFTESWNHWMFGLEGTLKNIQFQCPAMGSDLKLLKSMFYFQKQLKERAQPLAAAYKPGILKTNFCPS